MSVKPLPAEALARRCDPATLGFETTATLADAPVLFGQGRALKALRFGADVGHDGYNIFVMGRAGSGKHEATARLLREIAAGGPLPHDWAYVHNFADPVRPRALKLRAGNGRRLRDGIEALIEALERTLPQAFATDAYRAKRAAIDDEYGMRRQQGFDAIRREAEAAGLTIVRSPQGLGLMPVKDGQRITPEDFESLPEEEQDRLIALIGRFEERLQAFFENVRLWEAEHAERLEALDREVAAGTIALLMKDLDAAMAGEAQAQAHLAALREDVAMLVPLLRRRDERDRERDGDPFHRYRVNLVVDNGDATGAPVLEEHHPIYPNLCGRVEQMALYGSLLSDFTLIRAGALHRANGGFLMLDAWEVLTNPLAWEALKRALREKAIRIETPSEHVGLAQTVTLQPEPIPLDIKVVLYGQRHLFYYLAYNEPDFADLFKVQADFEDSVDRDAENVQHFARFVAGLARREKFRPLAAASVARLVEHASRLAHDGAKLSLLAGPLKDVMSEADYWAAKAGRTAIAAEDIDRAVAAKADRAARYRDRDREMIARGTIMIDTAGTVIGQINALTVYEIAGFAFGRPARVTARVKPGSGDVVDIERQVELGGAVHSKGVYILQGFLGSHYAGQGRLSLHASIAFEQSYGAIDGDSASAAELFAILSAIAEVPIRQGFAITGSINQLGRIQAIGGVNEKIEGFFDVCASRGLSGKQGVIIPRANVENLMLKREVVEAAAAGRFAIHAIETMEEGIELLTGWRAGARRRDGSFPGGTFNRKVADRLARFSQSLGYNRRRSWFW